MTLMTTKKILETKTLAKSCLGKEVNEIRIILPTANTTKFSPQVSVSLKMTSNRRLAQF